jgi:Uma2 family endonuclease
MTLYLQRRLLTVAEYQKMGEVGILTQDDRVELINGEIIKMSPFKSTHTSHVKRLNALLSRLVAGEMTISVQDPITIDPYSEPEPDIALLKPSKDFYAKRHPEPKDVYLVIEVADSTLEKDQTVKLELYAKAGIKEYWIVNLIEKQIEVYKNPKAGNYKQREIIHKGYNITLPKVNVVIRVNDILS